MNKLFDNTKRMLGLSMTGAAVLPLLASCAAEEPKNEKPMNILFIMCDDHSYQTISAYDSTFIRTPNIDRIAADGVLHDDRARFLAVPDGMGRAKVRCLHASR